MEDLSKSDRIISLLIQMVQHPKTSYSVSQLMAALNLPKDQRRNVERDLKALTDMPGSVVICEGKAPRKTYRLGLVVFNKFDIPDFNELILKFVFLRCVSHIYPGTGDLIEELTQRTFDNLPVAQQEKEKSIFKDISSKVLYMGKTVEMDDTASEKLKVILDAIRTGHMITTTYDQKGKESERLPLAIVVYQSSVYVACRRHGDPLAVYAIKLNRIQDVAKSRKTFTISQETWDKLQKKVSDLDLFDDDDEPIDIRVAFPLSKRKFVEDDDFHHSASFEVKKGKLYMSMRVCNGTQLLMWIMRHSVNDIEILEPDWLRDEIRDQALDLANRHRTKN